MREQLHKLIWRFGLGAIPFVVLGALLLAEAPLGWLQHALGVILLLMIIWRHVRRKPRPPSDRAFLAVGAASGLGSALLGSVGPLTAPFFLAKGLRRDAYIGTEACCALLLHLTKTVAYGATSLLDVRVLILGLILTPATLAGAWTGKRIVGRMSDRLFVRLIEAGLVAAAVIFLIGP
jgi:uncharacterized membrane protein YfcA